MTFFTQLAKLSGKIKKLSNRSPRYLLGLALWKTNLCQFFIINRGRYRIRFFPTALSFALWLDPLARRSEEDFFFNYLQPGDIFVDVGANIGNLSLSAAQAVGVTGHIVSFEPHPRTYTFLKRNFALNKIEQAVLLNIALGNSSGVLSFSDKGDDDQNSVSNEGLLRVPVKKLEEVFSEQSLSHIHMIKIDVEGYELFVLQGLGPFLDATSCIYFESDSAHFANYGYTCAEIINTLLESGFTVCKANLGNKKLWSVTSDYSSKERENLIAVKDMANFIDRTGFVVA